VQFGPEIIWTKDLGGEPFPAHRHLFAGGPKYGFVGRLGYGAIGGYGEGGDEEDQIELHTFTLRGWAQYGALLCCYGSLADYWRKIAVVQGKAHLMGELQARVLSTVQSV
jgi:hypothetical protein